ncbi:MAG: Gfo/Idh/MocA family oxidoreductase [Deltaproteobacteria bacterium]|nr:Gfo/Idh/MocA family oxidoreductase [Deltaproteobacteria bacterium]
MKRLKAAIIGCGKIGSSYDNSLEDRYIYSHAKAYLLNPHIDLIAVCDKDPSKLEQFTLKWGSGIECFESSDDLLARHRPDIFSICTPTPVHEKDLLRALDTNIPYVLCEKPFVEDLGRAVEISDLYRRSGKTLLINHVLRWEPGIQKIWNKLEQGTLGPVQTVSAVYAKGLLHNGIHIVDLTLQLFGEPMDILKLSEFTEVPDDPTCNFVFLYPGFQVVFQGLRECCYSIFEYTMFLEGGKIIITDLTNRILLSKAVSHPFLDGYRYLSPEPEAIPSHQYENMALVINDIIKGILGNYPGLFRCTAEDACRTLNYLKLIRELECRNR